MIFLDKEIFEFVPKVEVCGYVASNKDFVNKIAIADVDKAMTEMKNSYNVFQKIHNESMKNINKLEANVRSLKTNNDKDEELRYRVIKHYLSQASKAFSNQFSLITKVFSYFKTLNQRSSSQFTKIYNYTMLVNKFFKQVVKYSNKTSGENLKYEEVIASIVYDSGVNPSGEYVKGEEKEDKWTKETVDGLFKEIDLTVVSVN